MNRALEQIISAIKSSRGYDFSGYRQEMISRRIDTRLPALGLDSINEYSGYIAENADELDKLIEILTINVSSFFRNPLTFEYIAEKVLPDIIQHKQTNTNLSLRVWSAGCASGEEPYSMALLINECIEKEKLDKVNHDIFATDLDNSALADARRGIYDISRIENTKYSFLNKYFTKEKDSFLLDKKIRDMVRFSLYDMVDKKSYAPPESIFGGFDIILCRNLLIYFQQKYQLVIFEKLFKALDGKGYLILGEAETIPEQFRKYFRKENDYCHVYQKISG